MTQRHKWHNDISDTTTILDDINDIWHIIKNHTQTNKKPKQTTQTNLKNLKRNLCFVGGLTLLRHLSCVVGCCLGVVCFFTSFMSFRFMWGGCFVCCHHVSFFVALYVRMFANPPNTTHTTPHQRHNLKNSLLGLSYAVIMCRFVVICLQPQQPPNKT